MDRFQIWLHDKMLWLQHFITCHILPVALQSYLLFLLLSLIYLEVKTIKIHVNFFIAVRSLILKFRDFWFDLKSMIFIAQGYWLFTAFWRNNFFLEQCWYILFYHVLFYQSRLNLTVSPTFNLLSMWNRLNTLRPYNRA